MESHIAVAPMIHSDKKAKVVFVIMPFNETPTRDKGQLTSYFENEIRKPIESGQYQFQYHVRRSDDTFNITEQIIKDLYAADIVICDLSGLNSNPNVMYELGIRLAFSNKPVILIREAHKDNKRIFDIGGFYAEPYDPLNYSALREHLSSKIKRFEKHEEVYHSPVLKIVAQDQPLLVQMSASRAAQLLDTLSDSLLMNLRILGGAIHSFLMSRTPPVDLDTKDVLQLLMTMRDKIDILEKIDWGPFYYTPGAQPTLDHYLATRYLFGLVDDDIEHLYTKSLIQYYGEFIGCHFSAQWTPNSIINYYAETAFIRSATNAVIKMLVSTDAAAVDDAKKKTREVLVQNLQEK